jgi:superfamily I DNA/RNA helicase
MDVREQLFNLVPELMSRSLSTINNEVYFPDMIAGPVFDPNITVHMPFYELVFLDEAQDTDPAQQQIILVSIGIITDVVRHVQSVIAPKLGISEGEVVEFSDDEPQGKLVLIGDPYQSIYGFRGATYEGMDVMVEMLREFGNVHEYKLTQTRRSARAIVEHAQAIVPDIQTMDGAPEGAVNIITMDDFVEEFSRSEIGDDIMVLARITSSLVSPALKLVKKGMPVKVAGNVMAKQLIWRIKRINRKIVGDDSDKNATMQSIRMHILAEVKNTSDSMANASPAQRRKLGNVLEELDTLTALIDDCVYLHDIIHNINTLFHAEEGERYALFSTVHKQKGGEAATVYILDGEKMPHELATTEQELQQERHLAYVAVTRAKLRVVWVGSMAGYFA